MYPFHQSQGYAKAQIQTYNSIENCIIKCFSNTRLVLFLIQDTIYRVLVLTLDNSRSVLSQNWEVTPMSDEGALVRDGVFTPTALGEEQEGLLTHSSLHLIFSPPISHSFVEFF